MAIPDGKKITMDYLRTYPAIVSLSSRVVGKTPETTGTPWVRVTQLDARNAGNIAKEHFIDYLLQLDCVVAAGDGQPQARSLAHAVRDGLWDMQGVRAGVVVTATEVVGEAEEYDDNLEPARDYVALTARVLIHP